MERAAEDRAFQLVSGFRSTQMVRAACALKIPDLVAAGPRSSDELAALTGVQSEPLRRVLRCLGAVGVFAEIEDGRFAPTPGSECVRDQPGSQRGMTLMLTGEGYEAFGDLMHTLRTGQPAFEHVFGMTHFERLSQEPERSSIFNAAMQSGTERMRAAFISAFVFSPLPRIVDG